MKQQDSVDILIVGTGIAGIATAYYLCAEYHKSSVLLVDSRAPMSFTSAQSGDNYRNWWPHPTMVAFTDESIALMERLAGESDNVFNLNRRGYALATRSRNASHLIEDLYAGYGAHREQIRIHDGKSTVSYLPPTSAQWRAAPDGVDVLADRSIIRRTFPSFCDEVRHVVHVRRAGDFDGRQLGQYMLEKIRDAGGTRRTTEVTGIETDRGFVVRVSDADGVATIRADVVVNAAGPFAGEVAGMLGVDLPVSNVYQQKIAFDDTIRAIPRDLPFSIDLDEVELGWTEEEREFLANDPETAWLAETLIGGAHCRPDGGDHGTRVKLGWAFNRGPDNPQQDLANEPRMHPQFPELVVRAASRLNPSLGAYLVEFPTRFSHYGGYYTMTAENWPLIGPLGVDGAFITGALSGFGSMAACAAGRTCAAWIAGGELPHYADQLSPRRYGDDALMADITAATSKGLL